MAVGKDSEEDEGQLAVAVARALLVLRHQLPRAPAAGSRRRLPACLSLRQSMTATARSNVLSHGQGLTLDADRRRSLGCELTGPLWSSLLPALHAASYDLIQPVIPANHHTTPCNIKLVLIVI